MRARVPLGACSSGERPAIALGRRFSEARGVSYRGEDDAQRARIEELERQLDGAQQEIAALRGATAGARPGTTIAHSKISGGPSTYVREIVVPHGVSEAGYEAIASVLRTRLGLNASQVGRALTVPGSFSLTPEGDGVRIRLSADWRSFAGGVVSLTALTGTFGTLMAGGVLADVIHHGVGWQHPAASLAATIAVLATSLTGSAAWWSRRRASRFAHAKLADYEGTFEAIAAIAREHAIASAPKARVELADDAVDADEAVAATQRARA